MGYLTPVLPSSFLRGAPRSGGSRLHQTCPLTSTPPDGSSDFAVSDCMSQALTRAIWYLQQVKNLRQTHRAALTHNPGEQVKMKRRADGKRGSGARPAQFRAWFKTCPSAYTSGPMMANCYSIQLIELLFISFFIIIFLNDAQWQKHCRLGSTG